MLGETNSGRGWGIAFLSKRRKGVGWGCPNSHIKKFSYKLSMVGGRNIRK